MTFIDAFALKFGLRIIWFFNRLSLIFFLFPCCGLYFVFMVEFSIEVSFIYSNNWAPPTHTHTDGELLSNSTVPDGIILTPSMYVKTQWPLLRYKNIDFDGTVTVQLNINGLGFIAGTDLVIDSHHAHRPVHLYSLVLTWIVITGSARLIFIFGKRFALMSFPLVHFPDSCKIYGLYPGHRNNAWFSAGFVLASCFLSDDSGMELLHL